MARGDTDTRGPGFIVAMIISIIMIVLVVLFLSNSDLRAKIGQIIPDFTQNSSVTQNDIGIIRYSLSDGDVSYYTGSEWRALAADVGFEFNGKQLTRVGLSQDFQDYYYSTAGAGVYQQTYASRSVRPMPGSYPQIIAQSSLDPSNNLIRNVMVTGFLMSLGERYPSELQTDRGFVVGNFEQITQVGGAFTYVPKFFVLSPTNGLYATGSVAFIEAGRIVQVPTSSPVDDSVGFVDAIHIVDDFQPLDSATAASIGKLNGLLYDGSLFYEPNSFGDFGEETEFHTMRVQGKDWVYRGDQRLQLYIESKLVYSFGQSYDFTLVDLPNERELARVAAAWRDSIFVVPLEVHFTNGGVQHVCVERFSQGGKTYLVARLGTEAGETCNA